MKISEGKNKGKISLCFTFFLTEHHAMKAQWGSELLASRPGRFTPRESATGTHWIGGWMGPS
jgi:hypothetical protein